MRLSPAAVKPTPRPEEPWTVTTHQASISLVSTIFGLTYLALALGKVPGLRINRAGIALVGAAAMLACGVLPLREAAKAVNYETIVLLFGMMVVVATFDWPGSSRWRPIGSPRASRVRSPCSRSSSPSRECCRRSWSTTWSAWP